MRRQPRKMKKLKRGAQITMWFGRHSSRGFLAHFRVVRAGPQDVLVKSMNGLDLGRTFIARSEEGDTWVRGWDSPEARALEVAYRLTRLA